MKRVVLEFVEPQESGLGRNGLGPVELPDHLCQPLVIVRRAHSQNESLSVGREDLDGRPGLRGRTRCGQDRVGKRDDRLAQDVLRRVHAERGEWAGHVKGGSQLPNVLQPLGQTHGHQAVCRLVSDKMDTD